MRLSLFIASITIAGLFQAAYPQNTPWGIAAAPLAGYAPQKVVYDISVDTPEELGQILDRMSALNIEYGSDPYDAAIIAVLQGPEMRFFDTRRFPEYEKLVRQAQELTTSGVIEFRMCQRAARLMDIQPEHVHGFIELVPMADAEIIRLQQEEGYAYMK